MRLSGKTSVVTGAASGIGRATALRLVAEGATVVAGDIDADAGASLSREYKGKILVHRTDVCLPDEIKALMDFAGQQMGGIDILFNNASAGGAPECIDEMAFLASDDAAFITGTHVPVDGDMLIGPRHSWDPESPGMSDAIRKPVDAPQAPG